MNIYNFNNTLYKKNCGLSFYWFCLKKHFSIIRFAIIQLWAWGMYLLGIWSKQKFREKFFVFLKGIEDLDSLVEEFWQKNESLINTDLLKNKTEDDILISIEPRFLLQPIAEKYDLTLIASDVSTETGKHYGLRDCAGKLEELQDLEIQCENMYSSTRTDLPILKLAKQAYIVDKKGVTKLDEYKPSFMTKVKENFFTVEFCQFLVLGVINTLNSTIASTLFSVVIHPNLAFICGYIVSLVIAYVLNSLWIFKQKLNFKKLIMFAVSYIPNFIIQNGIVFLLFNLAGLNPILVYALAAIIGIPITFICVKVLCFLKKKK